MSQSEFVVFIAQFRYFIISGAHRNKAKWKRSRQNLIGWIFHSIVEYFIQMKYNFYFIVWKVNKVKWIIICLFIFNLSNIKIETEELSFKNS